MPYNNALKFLDSLNVWIDSDKPSSAATVNIENSTTEMDMEMTSMVMDTSRRPSKGQDRQTIAGANKVDLLKGGPIVSRYEAFTK